MSADLAEAVRVFLAAHDDPRAEYSTKAMEAESAALEAMRAALASQGAALEQPTLLDMTATGRRRIDAAAEALSEVMAFEKLSSDRATKVERALSGLRAMQSLAPSAAPTGAGDAREYPMPPDKSATHTMPYRTGYEAGWVDGIAADRAATPQHPAVPAPLEICEKGPMGWRCTRDRGHEGPCAEYYKGAIFP